MDQIDQAISELRRAHQHLLVDGESGIRDARDGITRALNLLDPDFDRRHGTAD